MKTLLYIMLCCGLLCAACGPKNVGESDHAEPDGHVAATPGNELRYPMMGNRTQQRLYYFNQPEVMQYTLDTQRAFMRQRMGLEPKENAPNNYNNLQPRQASPFRQ